MIEKQLVELVHPKYYKYGSDFSTDILKDTITSYNVSLKLNLFKI